MLILAKGSEFAGGVVVKILPDGIEVVDSLGRIVCYSQQEVEEALC